MLCMYVAFSVGEEKAGTLEGQPQLQPNLSEVRDSSCMVVLVQCK